LAAQQKLGLCTKRRFGSSRFDSDHLADYRQNLNFNTERNMMKMNNSFKAAFASMMIISGLVACDKPGTAESAGKKIDQATESATSAISNTADKAEQTLTKQKDAASRTFDDTEITAKVKTALLNESGLQSTKIKVSTEKGVVTLSGTVNTKENEIKAVKLTESTDGVNSVKNKLTMSK